MFSLLRRLFDRAPRTVRRDRRATVALEALENRLCPTTTDIWTGGGGQANPQWSYPQNWQAQVAPSPGDSLDFSGKCPVGGAWNDYPNGTTFNTITLAGPDFQIAGDLVDLKGGLISSAGNNTVSLPLTLTASQTFNDEAGASLTLSKCLNNGGNLLTVEANGNVMYNGPAITGTGGLTMTGNVKFVLADTSSNTYSGVTTVDSGTLFLDCPQGNSIVGNLVVGDGIGSNESDVVREAASNQIADTSSVFIASTGLLDLNGYTDTIGPLTMHGGNVSTGTGTLTLNGGITTQASPTAAIISPGPGATLGYLSLGTSPQTFTTASGTATNDLNVTTIVTGSSAAELIKAGPGSMQLLGSNTYSGQTLVSAGALVAANSNALGATSAGTTVSSTATLDYQDQNADSSYAFAPEPVTLNGGTLLANGNSPNLTVAGQLTLAADSTIEVNTGTTLNLTGLVTGPGGFSKTWAGALDLVYANTYAGLTTVSNGVLALSTSQALGSGSAKVGAQGVLELENGLTYAATPLSLGGTLLSTGNATWVGAINLTGAAHVDVAVHDTLLLDSAISGGAANSLTFGDAVNFPTNAGLTMLTSANTYAGATEVSVGTLALTNADALGSPANKSNNSGTTVDSGATLELLGGVSVDPSESLTLNGTGVNNAGALLDASGNDSWNGPIYLASNTSIDANPGTTLTINGVISGPSTSSLTIGGGGTVVLAGTNTFEGYAHLTAGILSLDNAQALGGAPLNGGAGITVDSGATLQLQGGITYVIEPVTLNGAGVGGTLGALQSLSGTNTWQGPIRLSSNTTITSEAGSTLIATAQVVNEGYTLTIGGAGNVTLATTISGAGGLIKDGTGTLTFSNPSSNLYTGQTIVNAGTLFLSKAASAEAISGAGAIINSGGTIAGSGTIDTSVTVNTGGRFTFAGTINGSLSNAGLVSPAGLGAIGTVTINGDYTQTPNGTLDIEIASAKSYDQLNISGNASLAGTLNIFSLNGYQPRPGSSFVILTFASYTGRFAPVNLPNGWSIVYNPTNVTIAFE